MTANADYLLAITSCWRYCLEIGFVFFFFHKSIANCVDDESEKQKEKQFFSIWAIWQTY